MTDTNNGTTISLSDDERRKIREEYWRDRMREHDSVSMRNETRRKFEAWSDKKSRNEEPAWFQKSNSWIEGNIEAEISILRQMYASDFSLEQIAKITGYTVDEVKIFCCIYAAH